ncbi:MAG: hypothetical protein M3O36_00850, partial [Myxococcota bacterium]|nr:hypothetical protein [Myxococcota bacterium]
GPGCCAGGGGATPTIVPFNLLGIGAAPGGRGGGAAAGGGGVAPGWFIISIVPLNFGAAAPLR